MIGSQGSPLKVHSAPTGQSFSDVMREACVGVCLEPHFYLEPISVVTGALWSLTRKERWRHQKQTSFNPTLAAVVSGLRGGGGKKGRGHAYYWKLGSNKEGEFPLTSSL